MAAPSIGRAIPDCSGVSPAGRWPLKNAPGSALVLTFHPRDPISGCRRKGGSWRDRLLDWKQNAAAILDVAPDTGASHETFRFKCLFHCTRLAEPEQPGCRHFEVRTESSRYGRSCRGVERSTLRLAARGDRRRARRQLTVDGGAAEVLAAARAL